MRCLLPLVPCLIAASATAAPAPPPAVTLHLDQPAYAGLPVWLDVKVADPCQVVRYRADLMGDAFGGRAIVSGPGARAATPGFKPFPYFHGGTAIPPPDSACPGQEVSRQNQPSRIPLHLVADLRRPGQYAVRWVGMEPRFTGAQKADARLTFTVLPTTKARRDAWIAAILAHPPAGHAALQYDYLPSLLAARDDSRIRRRLLDLACANQDLVRVPLYAILGPALPGDALSYLATKLAQGQFCPGVLEYLRTFPLSPADQEPPNQRRILLAAAIGGLRNAHGTNLAHGLAILSWLKGATPNPAVDNAVLARLPEALAGTDRQAGSAEQPKWVMIDYLAGAHCSASALKALVKISAQQDRAAGYALDRVIDCGDPSTLPFLRKRLASPLDKIDFLNSALDFDKLEQRFGPSGKMLLLSLLDAGSVQARTQAAISLARSDNSKALLWIAETLRNRRAPDWTELLNRSIGTALCPSEDQNCHEIIQTDTNTQAPWVTALRDIVLHHAMERLAPLHVLDRRAALPHSVRHPDGRAAAVP